MSERQACTKDRPMPKGSAGAWSHDDVHEIGEQEDGWPGGDIITLECRSLWPSLEVGVAAMTLPTPDNLRADLVKALPW